MSAVEQLGAALQELQHLKPPGVNKSKIDSITKLCILNVESELALVQKLFTHFKNTPSTHKLGVIYIVDSVTRQWIEKARQSKQELSGDAAAPGTFASGVNHMTQQMTTMMNDLIGSAPSEQKEKIKKLIDIWERGNTFPTQVLSKIKATFENTFKLLVSTTPAASPPRGDAAAKAVHQPQNVGAELASAPNGVSGLNSSPDANISALSGNPPAQSTAGTFNTSTTVPAAAAAPLLETNAAPAGYTAAAQDQATLLGALATIIPPHIANNPQALNQQLQMIQGLAQAGIPQQQWAEVLAALGTPQAAVAGSTYLTPQAAGSAISSRHPSIPRDSGGQSLQGTESPAFSSSAHRQRSRSPVRQGSQTHAPRRSPTYDTFGPGYDGHSTQQDRARGNGYRQRSPLGMQNNLSLQADFMSLPAAPKWTDFDPTLAPGYFKVLSRTLFVGGTSCGEHELRSIFSRFGRVQSCIVNPERRHAFVKMLSRADAVAAKTAMENVTDPEITSKIRSTRWGVGFGPRDCCDFTTGISVIPINHLTDADRKWMHTAEYGGCGQTPIDTGLVVEEPDIEIGAGVSSKAISKRANEVPGRHDPIPRRGGYDGSQRFRNPQQLPPPAPLVEAPNTLGVPPLVPGFGFQFPGIMQYPPR